MFDQNKLSYKFNCVKELIINYGEYLKELYLTDIEVLEKERGHITTVIDRELELNIKNKLKNDFPKIGFYGEETGGNKDNNKRWIVDSIDGTANFIFGIPYFCISIALEEKDEIILGLVYNPLTKELFEAYKDDDNAYLNGKVIKVSKVNNVKDSKVVFGFSANYKNISKYYGEWKYLFENCKKGMGMLSPALNICNVAKGRIEVFIDFGCSMEGQAAASLILKKSGGNILNYDKTPWNHEKMGIIATNSLEI